MLWSPVLLGLIAYAACLIGVQIYALTVIDFIALFAPIAMGRAGWVAGVLTGCAGFVLLTRRPYLSVRFALTGLWYLLLLVFVCFAVLRVVLYPRSGEAVSLMGFVLATIPLGLGSPGDPSSTFFEELAVLATGLACVAPLWTALGVVYAASRRRGDTCREGEEPDAPEALAGARQLTVAALILLVATPLLAHEWIGRIRPAHPTRGSTLPSCKHLDKELQHLAPATVPALIKTLKTGDEDLRASAAYALGNERLDDATLRRLFPALELAARDQSAHVREYAVAAMGRLGQPEIVDRLGYPVVVEHQGRPDIVPALVAALRDPDESVRRFAADALGMMEAPAEAVPALEAAVQDADFAVRAGAERALGRARPPPTPVDVGALVEALRTGDKSVRLEALLALRCAGPSAAPAVPALIETLRKSDDRVDCGQTAAVYALANVGPAAVPALVAGLGDRDGCVRVQSAMALGLIGPAARDAIPALEQAAADENILVRGMASSALEKVRNRWWLKWWRGTDGLLGSG